GIDRFGMPLEGGPQLGFLCRQSHPGQADRQHGGHQSNDHLHVSLLQGNGICPNNKTNETPIRFTPSPRRTCSPAELVRASNDRKVLVRPLAPPIPVELWGKIPPAAQAAILALVQQYEQRLQDLHKQVAELQQRLNRNSTNPSRPPSSDPPQVKRRPPK